MGEDTGKAKVSHPVQTMFKLLPPAPRPGVVTDLVYYNTKDKPEYWTIRLYRDNLDQLDLSGEDGLVLHNWVSDIMRQLRTVEPRIYLEIFETTPRRPE